MILKIINTFDEIIENSGVYIAIIALCAIQYQYMFIGVLLVSWLMILSIVVGLILLDERQLKFYEINKFPTTSNLITAAFASSTIVILIQSGFIITGIMMLIVHLLMLMKIMKYKKLVAKR